MERFVAPNKFGLADDYEFRVPGLQRTKFLVRGVQDLVGKHYTSNIYAADFSDQKAPAEFATEDEWNAGTVVKMPRDTSTSGAKIMDRSSKFAELQGLRFMRSGDAWGTARLSPDRSVLIVESWSGTLTRCGGSDVPGGFDLCVDFRGSHGKLFFDVYNADTGRKFVTLTAKFSHILPEQSFEKTGWVTERYFIIPLDDKRERCLVCEFGRGR